MSDRALIPGSDPSVADAAVMEVEGGPPLIPTSSDGFENVATTEDWRRALGKVVPAVVVLRTTAPHSFDTEPAGAAHATGFVVDKRRGIILTNRHVVKAGPVVAEAMFVNREEIPVLPIYRDPVHDFGFFRYDPSAIQFLQYEEIALAPEAACVGLEIRVVGNDSGEKVSILAGTLARLDREAPHYRKDGYNDFNTFYMQAASGTKGGSSGSPVIDSQGRAVALNAGSKSASASAYFFPLERVVRALKYLQEGKSSYSAIWEAVDIPRGTLQVTFLHKGFDETRRLGLRNETEQMVRCASPTGETGMLVVDATVPGGPAHNHLEPGDVLIRLNGEHSATIGMVTTQFLNLESVLDGSVGQKIELFVERGGIPITINLMVQDLHSITPDYFLEVSGGVIHPLSYQQARNFRFQCGLVFVAEPGYMLFRAGVPRHSLIKKLAGEEISRLDDLIAVLSKLSRGSRVPLEYIGYMDRYRPKSVLLTVDRHEWYAPPLIYTREDSSGLWVMKSAFQPLSPLSRSCVLHHGELAPGNRSPLLTGDAMLENLDLERSQELINAVANMETHDGISLEGSRARDELDAGKKKRRVEEELDGMAADCSLLDNSETLSKDQRDMEPAVVMEYAGATALAANASFAEHVIEPTLVMFEVHIPPACIVDGAHSQHYFGTGVIVHHSEDMGLVAVDKNTVALSISDVMISFAAFPIEIPGEVVFLHPVHNFALVAYDPSALGSVGASAVRAAELLPEPALRRGDLVYLMGLSRSLQATSRKSIVTNPCAAINIVSADCPRYRAMNMEVIELDTDFGGTFSGVLSDEHGRVQAIWASFSTQLKLGYSTPEDHQFVRGVPVYTISEVVNKIVSGTKGPPLLINGIKRPMPLLRILEVELYPTLLSKARSFGLSNNWVQALVKKDPLRRQVLRVKGCLAGSKVEKKLEQGDMILAINKEPVTCFRDVENACQALDNCDDDSDGNLSMTIFRQGQELDVLVGTDVRDGNGTTRVVNWCGCLVQDPHPAVRALGFLPKEGHGVYLARWCNGSPVHRYGLYALQWIVEVNGKPTPDLDAFVNVTKELQHGEYVRVRTILMHGKPRVTTVKQDLHYWPTWELRFDPETATWRRRIINSLSQDSAES